MELIWTISPAIVLIFIAFPSFKLLFLVDDVPNACITINVTGFILYGLILYIIDKIRDASYTREKIYTFQYSDVSSNRLAQVKGTGYFFTKNHIRSFHSSSRANKRIGPHNHEVISILIGKNLNNEIKTPLNPNWITGFIDAEGSFMISIIKSNNTAIGWKVTPIFSINLHSKDIDLLERLKLYFGVGNITNYKKREQAIYTVRSVKDIYSVIIPHFSKYTLLTKKQADFVLFKQIVKLIFNKEHLNLEGLKKILELKVSLNKGLPIELEKNFNNLNPVNRPIVLLPENIDINWFIGFIDGEGSFVVNVYKRKTKLGYSVQLHFNLTQHIRDASLFKFIQKWLGCGNLYEIDKYSRVNLIISNLQDLNNILIPKLNQYPLQGIKKLNYEDFKLVVELILKKEHLNLDGLNKIKQIKSGMNTGRVHSQKVETLGSLGQIDEALKEKQLISINSFINIQKRSFHSSVRPKKRIGPHNKDIISTIIGSLLGTAHANSRTIEGVRFCYRQSEIHQEYLFFLYNFFSDKGYCSNLAPRKYTRKLVNKTTKEVKEHYGYEFNTYTFSSLKWIHNLFYKKGVKFISPKLEQYLTPLALAIWIMDDACWVKPGVRIATCCFSLDEVKLLVNMLTKLYSLNCTIQKIDGRYYIYILKESIPKLREVVLPHMIPSMYYKLNVKK